MWSGTDAMSAATGDGCRDTLGSTPSPGPLHCHRLEALSLRQALSWVRRGCARRERQAGHFPRPPWQSPQELRIGATAASCSVVTVQINERVYRVGNVRYWRVG